MSLVSNPALTKADLLGSSNFIIKLNVSSKSIFAFLLNSHVFYFSNPSMHILYLVLTLREVKIIFQTFTTSGTSKLPVPHLFYFCFSFPTFPSPLSAFSLLCKWEGIEENTQLTQRNRSGENVCSPPHSTQSWLGLP